MSARCRPASLQRRLRAPAWLLAVALAATLAQAAPPGQIGHTPDLAERLDRLVRTGGDAPQSALAHLDAVPVPGDAASRRALALARAEVLARSGSGSDAAAALGEAVLTAAALAPGLAEADGQYLRALKAEHDGSSTLPALAASALAHYDAHCAALTATPTTTTATTPATPAAPPCEHRSRWRLHQLLGLQALMRQQPDAAHRHGQDGLALAQSAGDAWRQAGSECLLAQLAAVTQDSAALRQHLDRAEAFARRSGDAALQALVGMTEATTLPPGTDAQRARALLGQALESARRAGALRLEAGAWGNLSDLAPSEGRADEALRAARRGLLLSRRLGDHRISRVLEANAMLAQVRLGHAAAAQQELARLQAAWAAAGDHSAQLATLRQFGDALAATGDWAGALAMHHRERALGRELHASAREATLADLRGRYDREARQRSILMQARDNAVKAAAIENRALTQWLWMLGGGALALALLLVALLAGRVRATNRALARNQRQLRQQSERDALTGLANRRHAQARLQGRRAAESFRGGLLMLDIDHFKQINDQHGHLAGDAVLVQMAARLEHTLGAAGLVARWGGEEFLVALPEPPAPGELRALAQRLLHAICSAPALLPDGSPLAVSASIGHAGFPLPPHGVPLGLDQAIHLVDMALYLAKAQGRHRAVGVASVQAQDAAALRVLEGDLERAWREGRAALDIDVAALPLPAAHSGQTNDQETRPCPSPRTSPAVS